MVESGQLQRVSRSRFSVALATAVAAAALALPSVAAAGTVTFENTSGITIPALGNAAPYPTTIGVSGFIGAVQDVDATIKNLQHSSESDLTVLLVAPGGQSTILMSNAGSATGPPAPDETLTFDDEAAASLPCQQLTPVASGSYKPTRGPCSTAHPEAFPPPAPPGPFPLSLSVFDGAAANGVWSLYVIDEASGDSGVIARGWSLAITGPTDSTPPKTKITKHPKNKTKKKKATFKFTSSEPGSTFECRLDRNLGFSPCTSPQTVRKLGNGKHIFEVRATDQAGNTDAGSATDHWKVKSK